MTASPAFREKMYRAYLDFFVSAERKRCWHIFDDIPWESPRLLQKRRAQGDMH